MTGKKNFYEDLEKNLSEDAILSGEQAVKKVVEIKKNQDLDDQQKNNAIYTIATKLGNKAFSYYVLEELGEDALKKELREKQRLSQEIERDILLIKAALDKGEQKTKKL